MAKKKQQLQQQNNLVLIYGNQYAVDETLRKLREQVKCDESVRLDGESLTLDQLSSAICSEDMFASRKLILVRGLPKEDAPKLIPVLQKIPSSNFVVFYSYVSFKKKKSLCKYFSDYAKLIEYDTEIKDLDKIVTRIAKENGKTLPENVAHILSEYLGNNIGVVKSEIDKLCNYIGDRKEITIEDVRAVCCLNPEFVVWDLIKYIGDKNISKAVTALSSAIDSGYNYEFVILMLMRSIRLGIFLKEMDAGGVSLWDMTERIKSYKKSNGASVYGDYEIRKTYESRGGFFSNFSLWELCHALKSCHEAFLSVRKAYKKEEQEKEVSMLMFAICFPSCFSEQGE